MLYVIYLLYMINILYKVLAYGYKSAVVRSNISALWAASGKFLKKKSERFLYKFTMPRHDELTSENPPPFFYFFFMALLWMASAAASSRVKFRQRLNASEANFSSKKKKSAFSILIYLCKGTMY